MPANIAFSGCMLKCIFNTAPFAANPFTCQIKRRRGKMAFGISNFTLYWSFSNDLKAAMALKGLKTPWPQSNVHCKLTHTNMVIIHAEKLTAMNTGRKESTACTGKTNLLSSHRDSRPPDPSIVPHSGMALQHTRLCPLHTCGTTKPGPLSLPQLHLVHVVSAAYHGFCVKQIHHRTINTLAAQLYT